MTFTGRDYALSVAAVLQLFRNPGEKRVEELSAEGRQGLTPYDL